LAASPKRCADTNKRCSATKIDSGFLPVGQGLEFVHYFLQALQPPFLIGGPDDLLAALKVLAAGFTDLGDFFSQLGYALFDGHRHSNRLAEHFTLWSKFFTTI
jgi:hypothetical protein